VHFGRGISLYLGGRFPEALPELDRAGALLRERCTGVPWERGSALIMGVYICWFTGDLRELCRRVPLGLREAEERGDRYLATNLRSYLPNVHWLVQDDPEGAAREAQTAVDGWSRAGFHLQHMHNLVARTHIALYRGDAAEAHRVLAESWSRLRASHQLRMQIPRVYITYLRGAAALARAASLGAGPLGLVRRAALLVEAARAARTLDGERMPWADPLASLLRAGMAMVRGDVSSATSSLARAGLDFQAAGMELFAAASRRRRGELLGGDLGAALVREADQWMRDQGVVAPERMTAMLAPGFGR
jgi:hypothetical protein